MLQDDIMIVKPGKIDRSDSYELWIIPGYFQYPVTGHIGSGIDSENYSLGWFRLQMFRLDRIIYLSRRRIFFIHLGFSEYCGRLEKTVLDFSVPVVNDPVSR